MPYFEKVIDRYKQLLINIVPVDVINEFDSGYQSGLNTALQMLDYAVNVERSKYELERELRNT